MPTPSRIQCHPSHAVAGELVDALWAFHQRFVVRTRESFVQGIAAADEIWTLHAGGQLGGFASVKKLHVPALGRTCTVLYTQWAFIDPALRRQGFLHKVALNAWLRCKLRHPLRPVYWVFTASSVNAYMHMLRSMPVAYPRREAPMPPLEREVLQQTMQRMSPDEWDGASGTLRRKGDVLYLEGVVTGREQDADVQFYRSLNPQQARGDSLGCVAPATLRAAAAYLGRARRPRAQLAAKQ
jgi:hypothetical protein